VKLNLATTGGGTVPARPRGLEKIDHFIFVMQENRSFDSYFGTYPGADGIPASVRVPGPLGKMTAPYHDASLTNRGGPHDRRAALADINGGLMNGFLDTSWAWLSVTPATQGGGTPYDVMGYHDYREIPNYWSYADLYSLQDQMYEPVLSYTLPSHLYMLAGQSGGYVGWPIAVAPRAFVFPEITQVLHGAGVSWKYYVREGTPAEIGHNAIAGVVSDGSQAAKVHSNVNPLPAFPAVRADPEQWGRVTATTEFFADVASGSLPQVSWLVPSVAVSEHPPYNIADGMAYVTSIVDAVMQSPEWNHSAIFISWDEWGGFYDHAVPPRVDQYGLGLRVPGLVISPYAKMGYVDHRVASTESWLKIVEERYGVPSLTSRDTQAYDLTGSFDFKQVPRKPVLMLATPRGSPYPPAVKQ
jgi:phospholipase C